MRHFQHIIRQSAAAIFAMAAFPSAMAIDTQTAIFDPLIRTLTITCDDNLMKDPVLDLGGRSHITVMFDEIADDRSYLRCRLLHCNADWQPSMLQENEYVSGFNYMDIEDYAFSSNTFIHYVNYSITIPNDDMAPLASGNYLLQVFDRDEPDDTLLQVRFRVSEEILNIYGDANGRTDKGFNDEWQQLSLVIDLGQVVIPNPYTDLIVAVEQNHHPASRRVVEHPMRMEGSKIIYEHIPQLIFPAGNEYRRFETVRTNYPGMGIDHTEYVGDMYNAWLMTNEERASKSYIYDRTQRGRFKIDEYNATDPDLGADYVLTHFTFEFPEVMDGDVYVDGDLFLDAFSEQNKMKYDASESAYKLSVPLKQGSYNYRYVIVGRDDKDKVDASLTEGNKYETTNEYNVNVYLHTPGSRADRLLGTATILNNK